MAEAINTIIQGVLLGGLYALFAAGLSLIFGIMRLVNLAHGDLIVLAAFAILALGAWSGLDPFLATLLAIPVMFAFGFVLQHLLLNRTLGRDLLPPLLVTFGLSIIIQNGLMEGVLGRQPVASLRRDRYRLDLARGRDRVRCVAADHLPVRGRGDPRAQSAVLPHANSAALSAPPRTISRSRR